MRKKSEIHNHFQPSRLNDKDKVQCIYCNYVIMKNATRMTEHLQKCEKCPEVIRYAEFLTRPINSKKIENIKMDEPPGPDFSEINDWGNFSNDEEDDMIRTLTPPGKRTKIEEGISANPFIELEDTHVDYFFKSMALQVKTANLSQQNFIDLQIHFLNLFSAKVREYKNQ
ncbi:hypothetical protein DMENIID0001_063530 [Sergentomyia squamirostris]